MSNAHFLGAPTLIKASSLSEGYARIVAHIANNPGDTISPLILTIANASAEEMINKDCELQAALSALLANRGDTNIETVAFTIFPERYRRISSDRKEFFQSYIDAYPRLRAADRRNSNGLYFQRLVMWKDDEETNQLEWIIKRYTERSGVRESMFQAAVFDPERDHSRTAQQGFPCMQHISFTPRGGELALNAFYATQKVLRKAYGNYLGLIRLGNFMAQEMGLEFKSLNVFVGAAKLDEIGKTTPEFKATLDAAKKVLVSL